MSTTPEERLAILEVRVEKMEETLPQMAKELREIHDLLQNAKGARWALIAMATVGGYSMSHIGEFLRMIIGQR